MLTINTNLSSLIAQQNIKTSTSKLNQAIERMTTGFKVNRASDNAANYAIANQMTTKLNSLQVAEENTAMGIDLINTAEATLTQMQDRIERLRALQEQANNNTYGEDSLIAINKECNMLVNEINRLYESAEYNGITLFMAPTTLADGSVVIARESDAQLDTTFKEIGVTATHFEIFDSNNNFVQAYDLEVNDTINDFLSTLQTHGFSTKLRNGEITISSADGSYITGDLVDELGISTTQQSYVASTQQSYSKNIETTSAQVSASTVYTTTTSTSTATETIWITTTTSETLTNTIWATTTTSETLTNTIWTTTTTSETLTNTIWTTTTTSETLTNTIWTTTTTSETQTNRTTVTSTQTTDNTFINLVTARDTSTMTALSSVSDTSQIEGIYSISTAEELRQLASMIDRGLLTENTELVLANDIDISSSYFTSIGGYNAFNGIFDGNGYSIKVSDIRKGYAYGGIFGWVSNATIKNLEIELTNNYMGYSSIQGYDLGILAGKVENSTISNCHVTAEGPVIFDCESYSKYSGGLVGIAVNSTILSCMVEADLNSDNYSISLGGIAGYSDSTVIDSCNYTGLLNPRGDGNTYIEHVGGIVGVGNLGSIVDSYADVTQPGYTEVERLTASEALAQGYTTVRTQEELVAALANNESICLMNDIDILSVEYNGDTTSLGNYSNAILEGNGYSLTWINDNGGSLFGYVEDITIKNLKVNLEIPSNISSYNATGLFMETSGAVTVENSTITGNAGVSNAFSGITYFNNGNLVLNDVAIDVDTTASEVYSICYTNTGTTSLEDFICIYNRDFIYDGLVGRTYIEGVDALYWGYSAPTSATLPTMTNSYSSTGDCSSDWNGTEFTFDLINSKKIISTEQEEISTIYITTTNSSTVTETIYTTTTSSTTETETIWITSTTSSTQTYTIYTTTTSSTTETQTIYTTTTSSTTQTVTLYVTTTSSTTQTSTVWVTSTVAATGGTKFEELGVSSAFIVTIVSDGTLSALTINKTSTFDEFFAQLESKGFVVSENTGKIELNASGDTYIYSTFLNNLLKMSSVNKTEALKTVNTKSNYQSFDEILEDVYAPGTINLLVGTSAEPECSISVDVSFKLSDLTKFRNIGVDGNDYLDQIDSLLAQISDRQVQFGATLNRLDSVMDEIGIKYDNLVSSRSTIRDADIADVSAIYIQQQILQQASATLLATANQSPSIALQLI